jgi:hypothetical protein
MLGMCVSYDSQNNDALFAVHCINGHL